MSGNIGNRIRSLRQQRGYTQNDLGKLLYVSGQSVSKWEKGESTPSIETINLICEIFKVSPNELLNYKDDGVITNTEYNSDKIIQSSILSFFINILLYVLGTVCIYVFEVEIQIYPFNWIIGGGLWVVAIFFTIYTTINNILILKKINGRFKHIIYILTLILTSIILFPLISISFYQMLSEMINLLIVDRFNLGSWLHMYGIFLAIILVSVLAYIILLYVFKKKYSRK